MHQHDVMPASRPIVPPPRPADEHRPDPVADPDPMRPWDLPWSIRLGLPAALAFALQTLIMKAGGRPWDRSLIGGMAMAVFVAAWLRWRLPKLDEKKRALEAETGRGGWANPTPMQRVADRWFGGRSRREGRNPLSGNAPRRRR
jgi:hypothetical protein